jgi:hypothetical protein
VPANSRWRPLGVGAHRALCVGAQVLATSLALAAALTGVRGAATVWLAFGTGLLALCAHGTVRAAERLATALGLLPAAALLSAVAWLEVSAPFGPPVALGFHENGSDRSTALWALVLASSGAALLLTRGARRRAAVLLEPSLQRKMHVLRPAAWIAVGVASALLVASGARWHGVPPERYVHSLEVVASLPPLREAPCVGSPEEETCTQKIQAGPLQVTRLLYDGECMLGVAEGEPPRPSVRDWTPCDALSVRADRGHRLWFVEERAGATVGYDADDPRQAPRRIFPADVADGLRPPDAFVALAVLGLGAALATLLRRPRPLPSPAEVRVQAHLGEDGTLTFADDRPPLLLPHAACAGAGPVVVVLVPSVGAFRERGAEAVRAVLPGTLDEVLLAMHVGRHALALTWVAVGAAPLAAALAVLVR